MIAAAQEFVRQTKANFSTDTKYKEKPWAPLSPKYAKKVGHSQSTLKLSGALYNSILTNSPRANWIEVFTKNPYAAAHTFGYKPHHLPARNFWPIQFYSPTYSRPLYNSEKDLIIEIGKRFTIFSNGILPRLTGGAILRSPPQYGNPFASPQAV